MNANLVLLARSGKQKSIPLPSRVTVIGRRHNCDLRIPLESVSRRHCQLAEEDNHFRLRDLGSKNGTLLNGQKVEEEKKVEAGDFIQIGAALFALQVEGKPEKITPPPSEKAKSMPDDTDLIGDTGLDALSELDNLENSGDLPDLEDDEDEIDLDAL